MSDDRKRGLVERLKQVGAYDVRVADPAVGYEHVLPEQHPLDLWDQCRSVVVFAVACSPRTNNTYLGAYAPWPGERSVGPVPECLRSTERAVYRLTWLFVNSVRLRGMEYLQARGRSFSFLQPQLKLSAFEAGIGVYGRSGVILHPVLGRHFYRRQRPCSHLLPVQPFLGVEGVDGRKHRLGKFRPHLVDDLLPQCSQQVLAHRRAIAAILDLYLERA